MSSSGVILFSNSKQVAMDAGVIVVGYSLTSMLLPSSISGLMGVFASASGAALLLGVYSGNRSMANEENTFKQNFTEVGFAVGGIMLMGALGLSTYLTSMESAMVGPTAAILLTNFLGGFAGVYAADYMNYINVV